MTTGSPARTAGEDTNASFLVPVILLGHGSTASALLAAAQGICPTGFENVHAVDAGTGDCEALGERLGAVVGLAGGHPQLLIMVDIVGSSPWRRCVKSLMDGHSAVVLGGLSIPMLLKLATVERYGTDAKSVADACAGSAKRAIVVSEVFAED